MDYIPHTDEQISSMLSTIGVSSIEELLADVPAQIRSHGLKLPAGLDEPSVIAKFEDLAGQNTSTKKRASFLGFGAYEHVIPSVVDSISGRGEWLTPYTPYQAEASQGTLQMIYEFQSMICELMGMDVSNASLYDGASSLAEAALLAVRYSSRKRVLVSETVHPFHKQVLSTYLDGFGCTIQQIPQEAGVTDLDALSSAMKEDAACVLMQQPNVFGCLEKMDEACDISHRSGSLFVASVYPISLGVLKSPGDYGADIAVAEGRCLGSPLAFGGPGLGIFTVKGSLVRKMPGRLAGCTIDKDGKRGFTLTLQTREQHIRREKATSNICTNEGWLCLRAAMFLSMLGPKGLKSLALLNLRKAHELADRMGEVDGIKMLFDEPFFNEFVVSISDEARAGKINRLLVKSGMLGGLALKPWYPSLGQASLWCVTECVSKEDMDSLIEILKKC